MAGTSLAGALVKLTYAVGAGASLTNENDNLTAADYSQGRGIGTYSGNTDKAILTGFVPDDEGYDLTDFGFIASLTNERQVTSGANSGRTLGDLQAGNAAECGVYLQNHGRGPVVGNKDLFGFQALNWRSRVISFQSNGSQHHTAQDGVQMTTWAQASSSTLTGEIALLKSIRFGGTRYDNGVMGMVCLTAYMTPTEAKQATAAIAEFEQAIRDCYRSSPHGIMAVGDSITATQGATLSRDGFAPLVARRLGVAIRNFGNPSAWLTASGGPIGGAAQGADLAAQAEQLAVVMFGTNDGQYGVTASTYETALGALVDDFTDRGRAVVICSPCYSTNGTYDATVQRAYAEKCAEVAVDKGVMFADTNRAIADQATPGDHMADANHPNTSGHALMASRILAALRGQQVREVALDFGSLADGASETLTVEVLTALTTDHATARPVGAFEDGFVVQAWVSSADTVSVRVTNLSGGTVDASALRFAVEVQRA